MEIAIRRPGPMDHHFFEDTSSKTSVFTNRQGEVEPLKMVDDTTKEYVDISYHITMQNGEYMRISYT